MGKKISPYLHFQRPNMTWVRLRSSIRLNFFGKEAFNKFLHNPPWISCENGFFLSEPEVNTPALCGRNSAHNPSIDFCSILDFIYLLNIYGFNCKRLVTENGYVPRVREITKCISHFPYIQISITWPCVCFSLLKAEERGRCWKGFVRGEVQFTLCATTLLLAT